jgi:hypothetical protein
MSRFLKIKSAPYLDRAMTVILAMDLKHPAWVVGIQNEVKSMVSMIKFTTLSKAEKYYDKITGNLD